MLFNELFSIVLITSSFSSTTAVENSCYNDDDCEIYDYSNDYSPIQRTYCQINCPSDSYPPHTALLTSPLPLTLTGNAFIEVSPNRHPSFSGDVTLFAKLNQMAGTQGHLLFYGTNTARPNFSIFLDSRQQSFTILVFGYISRDDNQVRRVSLEIPSVANGEHCLTIIFQRTLIIYVDDTLAQSASATIPDLDLTTGLSVDDTPRLVIGGNASSVVTDNFQGTFEQIVIFNEFISDATRDSVCSFSTSDPIEGQCQPYLNRGDACVRPTIQQSTLCVSKVNRCDPSLRCLPDIFDQYTCQYVPPICTIDDDCFGSGFCGSAVPSYGSNYFESDTVDIPGEETTYISQAEEFDGIRIIRRPATDHPDLDADLTIITYVQQEPSNTGYVIAKGFDDVMRDWGLLLAYNRIALIYRTDMGAYETITFNGITVADGQNHSVAAIIDSTNKQAIIIVDGVVTSAGLSQQPEFQPGFNFLYIGGRPETTESTNNRFEGTIRYLSVYNHALSIDDIQKLIAEFQNNFVNPTELTTTRYCRDYVDRNSYCYLGDDKDFRCKPPAKCVPVVVNGNTAVQLPKQGESFAVSDIIGRCITPCDCDDETSSSQVCGSDGRTYASPCYANCASIEVVTNGACTMTYADLYNRM